MKIYVVDHVRPDYQVFASYDAAFTFAKTKADKRHPTGAIHFEGLDGTIKTVYNPIPWTDAHINIYEREMQD